MVVALAAVGLSALAGTVSRRQPVRLMAASVVTAVVGAVVVAGTRPAEPAGGFFGGTVAGVSVFPFDSGVLDLRAWTVVSIVAMIAIGLAAFRGPAVLAVVATALAVGGSIGAAGDARAFHAAAANGNLDEWADGLEPGALVIASDAARSPIYQFFVYQQQYALADDGWQAEFSSHPTVVLTDAPEGAALALVGDVGPSGWRQAGRFDQVSFWVRP